MNLILLLFVPLAVCTNYLGRQVDGTDVFTGIPYAQPPVGPLRFQRPLPVTGDADTVDASSFTSNRCFELSTGSSTLSGQSEDCLTLDIVRPSAASVIGNKDSEFPVYVFIHGGNFNNGDKSGYDGTNLVKTSIALGAPIVYVAINYRLSFLGFPTGSIFAGSYNLGLLDQNLALQWIKNEISYFGGDPTKIVVGGHSAGANSVAYQMTAQGSNGLFRGAVLESGSATALTAIQHIDNGTWQKSYGDIAAAVRCNVTDPLSCFQNVPISTLVAAYTAEFSNSGLASPISLFSPVPDNSSLRALSLTKFEATTNIPVIIGTTTTELVETVPIYNGIGSDAGVVKALQPLNPWVPSSLLQSLLPYYPVLHFFNVGPPLSGAQWSRTVAIENDIQIFCPAYTQAVQQAVTSTPVWKYRWNSVLQSLKVDQWDGVPHGSELYYIFPYNGENVPAQSTTDSTLAFNFQRHIIGFINTLNPNSLPALSSTPSIHWSQFDNKTQTRLVYQIPDSTGRGLFTEKDNINLDTCNFIDSNQPMFL